MANPLILLDARVFVAGADLSGYSNEVALDEEAEVKKITTWRSGGAEENKAGIHGCDIKANGLWEAGDLGKPDDAFWAMRRTMDPWSVAPRSDSDLAAGGLMWMIGKAVRTQFQFMGEVGEVAPWEGAAKSSWPLVRGVCAHPSGVPRTATGSGTIVQLGAVPTGKNIYVNLHVLSVAGTGSPTLTAPAPVSDHPGVRLAYQPWLCVRCRYHHRRSATARSRLDHRPVLAVELDDLG
jgi:hypothetical protein